MTPVNRRERDWNGDSRDAKTDATVESHVSTNETWGTPCLAAAVENRNHTWATRPAGAGGKGGVGGLWCES
jgi:hypothetical protein